MKRICNGLLAALLLLAVLIGAFAETTDATAATLETAVADIQKYGNLELELSATGLLGQGYDYGDIVTVTVNGQALDMPLGSNYSDVDSGSPICRAAVDETQDKIIVAINMGDFASTYGIAEKAAIEEEPGYRWDYLVETPVAVSIAMKEKGGYADEYMIHQLVRSNERADYPDLTDEQYANFRNIATTGMGEGVLYRSSSPVNPEINRNAEADEALNNAGIQTVLNLADSDAAMRGYEGFSNSYYSQRDVIALNLGVDFSADAFKEGLAQGLEFLAAHEGPYLVHCNEGKDRAGYVSALLECLMGASADEVVADYMVTYANYYGVQPGDERYDAIVRSNIAKSLAAAFGVEDIYAADLAACAEEYLRGIGLSDETIDRVKARLSASFGASAKGKVVILATGGTIAGVGEAGKTAGYKPGSLTAEELLAAVPELEDVAEIEAIQVCNVNSDDITAEVWLTLADTINEMALDPDVTGFVITHGTDTLEETAYFLNLTVKTDKPVVITGSMRPATSISADGPMNLYQAVCTAASKEAVGQGVLVVFSDRIYSARSVTKTSTYHVTAIAAGEMGAIGVIRDGEVYLYEKPGKKHTTETEFDVADLTELPRVTILYFAVDADPELLRFAADRSDGLVIAGAGAGEFSEAYISVIESLDIPVVISSRIDDGVITSDNLLCEGTVAADNLSPQKAAILLRLALTVDADAEQLAQMYLEY